MILIVHRNYRVKGGEDFFLERTLIPALQELSLEYSVIQLPPLRSWNILEILFMLLGIERFRPSYWAVRSQIRKLKPSHVIFNNFIPTVSLKLPAFAKSVGARTLAWVHNSRAICANGLSYNGKSVCQDCFKIGSHRVLKYKCHSSWIQSMIYAIAYRRRRIARIISQSVDTFCCVSNYALSHLKSAGINGEVFYSVDLMAKSNALKPVDNLKIPFVTFIGRISGEKGIDQFLELAVRFPQKNFVVCGDGPLLKQSKAQGLSNVKFLGVVDGAQKDWILKNSECICISSRVPENAPLVISESEPYRTPIIYPLNGGAEELVKHLERPGTSLDKYEGQIFEKSGEDRTAKLREEFLSKLKKELT